MEKAHQQFSAWVDGVKAEHGSTQKHLAKRFGVLPGTLSKWKTGEWTPGPTARLLIEHVTDGAVPSGVDWA